MRSIKFLALALLGIMLMACSDEGGYGNNSPRVEIQLTEGEQLTATNQNDFGFKLLRSAMECNQTSHNISVSPYSLSQVLAMLLNGASGEALSDIVSVFYNNLNDINSFHKKLNDGIAITDKSTKMEFVNGLWADKHRTFNADFIKTNEKYYGAVAKSFGSYEEILSWYKKNTSKNIYSPVSNLLSGKSGEYNGLTINNTAYFNGKWKKKFNKSTNKDQRFFGETGTKDANMMNVQISTEFFTSDLYEAVQIDYGNRAFSMVVVLPNENSNTSEVINELSNFGFTNTSVKDTKVSITMPQFEYERQINLLSVLENMGLTHLRNGSFPGISDNGFNLNIIDQYMSVKVDTEGTVVKVSTSAGGVGANVPSPPRDFIVNRPFIWLIKENTTNTILFIGKVGVV